MNRREKKQAPQADQLDSECKNKQDFFDRNKSEIMWNDGKRGDFMNANSEWQRDRKVDDDVQTEKDCDSRANSVLLTAERITHVKDCKK